MNTATATAAAPASTTKDGATLWSKNRATLAQVRSIPVPKGTRSWNPVSYGEAIDFLKHEATTTIGASIARESYGLNKAGDQMFGTITLDMGRADDGLAIGFRQSYNKSLALGVAVGAQVFVCDNLCFSSSGAGSFKVVRKNTTNVWGDFLRLVRAQLNGAVEQYRQTTRECDTMKRIPCELDRGYSILGVMQGRGLLTPRQASVAFGDWRTPRHEAFDRRDVWGLYNAVTEGLKKGPTARTMERHAAAHGFFVKELSAPARAAGPRVVEVQGRELVPAGDAGDARDAREEREAWEARSL